MRSISIHARSEQFRNQKALLLVQNTYAATYKGKKSGKLFSCYNITGLVRAVDPIYASYCDMRVIVNRTNTHGLFFINRDSQDSNRWTMPVTGALFKLLRILGLKDTAELKNLRLPIVYDKGFWVVDMDLLIDNSPE